ncbi:putative signal transducing protein [Marinobacterium lutimaris]|uniref:Putative signal transducing protein n=1 Tax=Marinobacterium lutimaris TaxID=568106 RepID=A0A1H5WYW7_9GAMM|nr:DUF2007 domain-containing protein [Marinobacterium lutimaris]SEG04280.1 Putative signal transducing protein [Marinobacterium lutimaris]
MQIVYQAQDIAEAHIVAGMLRASGIQAHVAGHYLQGAFGEVGTFNLAQVKVDERDFLDARILIDEYEHNNRDHNDSNEEPYGS